MARSSQEGKYGDDSFVDRALGILSFRRYLYDPRRKSVGMDVDNGGVGRNGAFYVYHEFQ